MKKEICKTKAEFVAMMKARGYSDKLSKEAANIVGGYGAFPKEKEVKSWNGKKCCEKIIARMPYHKENKPRCKLPCLLESNYCRLHQQEPQAYQEA